MPAETQFLMITAIVLTAVAGYFVFGEFFRKSKSK